RRLETEQKKLPEKNAALAQILEHIEQQRQDYKHQICQEIEQAIMPILERGKVEASAGARKLLERLETNLRAILGRDIDVFQDRFARLTPRELDICSMIRSGRTSKEIARELNLSLTTIHTHRQQIRKKLGITNKGVNLSTFLRIH
ncbi:MAG: LuxR C-terminal-related transcriptional regulator, partial [Candidatus Zixiibacteriota bacterium]